MKNLRKSSLLMAILILSISCGEQRNKENFDRSLILTNLADNLIIPAVTDFATSTRKLLESTQSFDGSAEKLETVRQVWIAAKLSWSRTELFNFGPIDRLALFTQVNNFPLNEFGLEKFLASREEITSSDIEAIASNQQGFPAIEYLLFAEDALHLFEENPERVQLLMALSERLNEVAQTVKREWESTYKAEFLAATGGELDGSTTILVNAMIGFLESSRSAKIAVPLGLKSAGGEVKPDLVESRFANISKELLIQNLRQVQAAFNGNSNAGNLNGFDDYLNELNIVSSDGPLSTAINDQFTVTINKLNEIQGTLQEAIIENPLTVNAALSEWQSLIVLVSVDMTSQLGIVVTYSDNDGD